MSPSDNLSADDVAKLAQYNSGWPAYPTQALDGSGMPCMEHCPGLSKRELFAAMAMQGWLSGCANAYSEFTAPGIHTQPMAESCVVFADALLKELAKERMS